MPKIKKIKPSAPHGRFAIVAARFNTEIVEGLLVGALKALNKHGVPEKSIDVVRVPGSLELALAAQRLGSSKKYVAVICLGAVIQGDTDHYDYVCTGTVNGITQAGLTTSVPTIFGVLTCQKMKQARQRSGDTSDNKGYEAALAAIEMAGLMQTDKLISRLQGN